MRNVPFTIGADPEGFFVDPTGKFISSIGRLGGSKHHPLKIREDGCAVQEDNVAFEFNIPACETVDQFVETLTYNLQYLTNKAKEMGLELAIVPSARFTDDQLSHPAAVEFGCDPDFNAWLGGDVNPKPYCADAYLRSAGGHVHIATKLSKTDVIKACDVTLGLWSLEHDQDEQRRFLYGKAGAFRPRKYGVEYRTLSNFWIKDEQLMRQVYDRTKMALVLASDPSEMDFINEEGEDIQRAINTGDQALANELREFFDC